MRGVVKYTGLKLVVRSLLMRFVCKVYCYKSDHNYHKSVMKCAAELVYTCRQGQKSVQCELTDDPRKHLEVDCRLNNARE